MSDSQHAVHEKRKCRGAAVGRESAGDRRQAGQGQAWKAAWGSERSQSPRTRGPRLPAHEVPRLGRLETWQLGRGGAFWELKYSKVDYTTLNILKAIELYTLNG